MIIDLFLYILAFVFIWIGSGLAINSVEKLSHMLRMSSFIVSFFVLSFFTSMSELSVGINSIAVDDPEIFVGNVIGGSIVLLFLVVPLLAIFGKNIRINSDFLSFNLPASLAVIAFPVLLSIDGKITTTDSLIALSVFFLLMFSIQSKKGILEKIKDFTSRKSGIKLGSELARVAFGICVIFLGSSMVVKQTILFADLLGISAFLISLLLISVGTNLPEIVLVFRSILIKDKQLALGNYIGSATFNTLLFGSLSLFYGKDIYLDNNYSLSLLFLIVGLMLFYIFSKSKNTISRAEGVTLLLFYMVFVGLEMWLFAL